MAINWYLLIGFSYLLVVDIIRGKWYLATQEQALAKFVHGFPPSRERPSSFNSSFGELYGGVGDFHRGSSVTITNMGDFTYMGKKTCIG